MQTRITTKTIMNKIYLLTFLLFFGLTTFGQSYTTKFETKSVVSQRLISLNGGMRASAGGKSRTVIQVNLPQGTTEWYYSFSTNPAGSGTKNLQLLMQVTAAVADPTKLSSFALSNIEIPSGSKTIDVYLLDQRNADAFINKVDNNGGAFYFSREGSVTATRQGSVKISQISGNPMYLGIKNPSSLEGVDITIEVVAVVATKAYLDTWTSENLDKIYNNCLGTFANKSSEAEQICNCLKSKIANDYTPSIYNQLSESSRQKLYKDLISNCATETDNTSIVQNDKKIKELYELLRGQSVTKDYEAQEQTFNELIQYGIISWEIYNGLGFTQLCLGKYEEAKKSLQIGLGKNPTELFLLGNLADYYLLTGKYEQAIEIFKEHKNKKLADKRRFKEAVSDDLKEFERLGKSNSDFDRVRKELKID